MQNHTTMENEIPVELNNECTPSEQFVFNICRKSFLSLWSYLRPKGKKEKELCDILVVCDPSIIIISVKNCKMTDSGDFALDWERWQRKAIYESIAQIKGAERWIVSNPNVIRNDGKIGLSFPDIKKRKIYRIVIAFGGIGIASFKYPNPNQKFFNVFDEKSLTKIMNELDTITDLIQYLETKETFYKRGVDTIFHGGEEDLLGFYLYNNNTLPEKADLITFIDDIWLGYVNEKKKNGLDRKIKKSRFWDGIIEDFSKHFFKGDLEVGNSLSEVENILRIMAKEDRYARFILSKEIIDFIEKVNQKKVRGSNARVLLSPSGIGYIFLICARTITREERRAELLGRCYVMRDIKYEITTFIGIATESFEPCGGNSMDAVLFLKPDWTDIDHKRAIELRRELGYFKNLDL